MNRMEEYKDLLNELEYLTETVDTSEEVVDRAVDRRLEGTLERAVARRKRKNLVFKPLIGFAASFALFVILVNFSTTVADACSQVPLLKELAEAVTFSPSLEDAVDNEYAQPMNIFDQDGDVSGKVEFLIVDQKQVNIFFRLYSDKYEELTIEPDLDGLNGEEIGSYSCGMNSFDVPNGELWSVTVDFVDDDVPDGMKFKIAINDLGHLFDENHDMTEEEIEEEMFHPEGTSEEGVVAHLEFDLKFDPEFTAKGEKIEVNQIIELEGQKISIDAVEIYPTHMRINISDREENTAWLNRLDFYVVTEKQEKFEPVEVGITSTGSTDTNTMTSYRADSTYFHEAKELKLVITGAEWLNKDMEKVYVNLRTEETGDMPEGVELYSAEEKKSGWLIRFKVKHREEDHYHSIMTTNYCDKDGKEYSFNSIATRLEEEEWSDSENKEYYLSEIRLADYHQDEVWLKPVYSHEWKAEKNVIVNVK